MRKLFFLAKNCIFVGNPSFGSAGSVPPPQEHFQGRGCGQGRDPQPFRSYFPHDLTKCLYVQDIAIHVDGSMGTVAITISNCSDEEVKYWKVRC